MGTHYNLAHFLFPRRNPPFLSGEVLGQWHHIFIYSGSIVLLSFSNSHSSARPCASSESSSTVGSGGQFMTPFCYYLVESCLKTSYTEQNFGRRFFTCVNYKQGRSCGFFHWYDPPMCVHGKRVLRRLREKHERLNMEVDSHAPMAEHGTANTTAKLNLSSHSFVRSWKP
ncbi:hypothetical protein CJ030_MR7G014274 [Morella rubra]|uniref:GRF-type domain-containing protein n=1 Tax=Morella rubra TaxID=262757 RepID=A0A6A1V0F1_9ROSI|nr:hypothetical protein CJ030_MR7G014274 [Morella rubra]